MATPRKTVKYRWNPRKLSTLLVTLLTVTVVLAGLGFSRTIVSAADSSSVQYREVTVAAGDTLWDIAGRTNHKGDQRDMVERIRDVNGLGARSIQPGQVLRVPID